MAKERESQEKGEARIQELMEMFPELPRLEVIKAEYLREGVRHTPILDEIGRWAWPDPHSHYENDYDEHSQQEDLAGSVSRTPRHISFGKRGDHQIVLNSRSPYEVRYEGGGRYWLYRDGEPIEQVYFLPCPQWFWKKTSSGKPMNLVFNTPFEGKVQLFVSDYCEYFKDGNQCGFCNVSHHPYAKVGEERMRVKREQDVYETFLAYAQETGVESISLIGGSFYNQSKVAPLYLRYLELVKRAMRDSGCQAEGIFFSIQAVEEQDQRWFKEAGVTSVEYNLEVWDPKLFEIFCPGKAKSVGRERWIECLLKGVEVFGWGKVVSNFVLGMELVPPFGFKTEEEAYESNMEGFQFLASHGVAPRLDLFQPRVGANLARAPRPRTEYFLKIQRERDKLLEEHNLVKPLSSTPVICHKGQP